MENRWVTSEGFRTGFRRLSVTRKTTLGRISIWLQLQEGTGKIGELGGLRRIGKRGGGWKEICKRVDWETYGVTMRPLPARNGSRRHNRRTTSRSVVNPIYTVSFDISF